MLERKTMLLLLAWSNEHQICGSEPVHFISTLNTSCHHHLLAEPRSTTNGTNDETGFIYLFSPWYHRLLQPTNLHALPQKPQGFGVCRHRVCNELCVGLLRRGSTALNFWRYAAQPGQKAAQALLAKLVVLHHCCAHDLQTQRA